MSDQLALFIDFENVAIWAEQHLFDLESRGCSRSER